MQVSAASATIGSISATRSPTGRSDRRGLIPSGWAGQKAAPQILVIEKIVSRPTASDTPATNHISRSSAALTTTYLAQKPDSGGKPASEKAGMRNRKASSGAWA